MKKLLIQIKYTFIGFIILSIYLKICEYIHTLSGLEDAYFVPVILLTTLILGISHLIGLMLFPYLNE